MTDLPIDPTHSSTDTEPHQMTPKETFVALPEMSTVDPVQPPLSKNAQKRLKRKLEWEAKADERKAQRKQKRLLKKQQPSVQSQENGGSGQSQSGKRRRPAEIIDSGIGLLIDLDFDDKMIEKVGHIILIVFLFEHYCMLWNIYNNRKNLFFW